MAISVYWTYVNRSRAQAVLPAREVWAASWIYKHILMLAQSHACGKWAPYAVFYDLPGRRKGQTSLKITCLTDEQQRSWREATAACSPPISRAQVLRAHTQVAHRSRHARDWQSVQKVARLEGQIPQALKRANTAAPKVICSSRVIVTNLFQGKGLPACQQSLLLKSVRTPILLHTPTWWIPTFGTRRACTAPRWYPAGIRSTCNLCGCTRWGIRATLSRSRVASRDGQTASGFWRTTPELQSTGRLWWMSNDSVNIKSRIVSRTVRYCLPADIRAVRSYRNAIRRQIRTNGWIHQSGAGSLHEFFVCHGRTSGRPAEFCDSSCANTTNGRLQNIEHEATSKFHWWNGNRCFTSQLSGAHATQVIGLPMIKYSYEEGNKPRRFRIGILNYE